MRTPRNTLSAVASQLIFNPSLASFHIERPWTRLRKPQLAIAHLQRHPEVTRIPLLLRLPDVSHEDDGRCLGTHHLKDHRGLRTVCIRGSRSNVPELRPWAGEILCRGIFVRIRLP